MKILKIYSDFASDFASDFVFKNNIILLFVIFKMKIFENPSGARAGKRE